MRRVRAAVVVALMFIGGAATAMAPPAAAQTGYPPGVCTTTVGSSDVGTFTIGQRIVVTLAPTCVFTPGAAVRVTVNGVDIPGKVANANGVVTVTITIVSATQLSVDDPVLVANRCGTNSVVATGPSAAAGRLSFTGSNVAKFVIAGLALVGIGWLFVTMSRRRRAGGVAG
jgi:hypothetical protein